MAVGTAAALGIAAGGALLGGIAGSTKDKTSFDNQSFLDPATASQLQELLGGKGVLSTSQQNQVERLKSRVAEIQANPFKLPNAPGVDQRRTDREVQKLQDQIAAIEDSPESRGMGFIGEEFQNIQNILGSGPDPTQAREAAFGAQQDLASLLQTQIQNRGLPGQEDISAARGITDQLFAPQQVAFQQQLEDARTMNIRQRQQLGRGGADPILAAKLAQEAARGQERIGAAQGAATQQLALSIPGQTLGLATQRAGLLEGIGNQALQARLNLLGLGSSLLGQERQYGLATGTNFAKGSQSSGGGLGGAISGGLAGAGSLLGAIGGFQQSSAMTGLLNAQATQVRQGGQAGFPSTGGFNFNLGQPQQLQGGRFMTQGPATGNFFNSPFNRSF